MWNVYADIDGKIVLQAEDCGSEELAWDVIEYMDNMEHFPYPLWYEFKGEAHVVH